MDAFVVRTPRSVPKHIPKKGSLRLKRNTSQAEGRQIRLKDLQGVEVKPRSSTSDPKSGHSKSENDLQGAEVEPKSTEAFFEKLMSNDCEHSNSKKTKNVGKQRTLNSLRGVVVLEDIDAFVTKLKSSEVGNDEKLKILKKLLKKQPSTEIIANSGIGKVVKKLMLKEQDPEIAKAARQVKIRWQNLIERRVVLKNGEKPEVISDLETRTTRNKALKFFRGKYKEVPEQTLVNLEKALFNHFRPVIGGKYRRSARKIAIHGSKFGHLLEKNDIDAVVKEVTFLEK